MSCHILLKPLTPWLPALLLRYHVYKVTKAKQKCKTAQSKENKTNKSKNKTKNIKQRKTWQRKAKQTKNTKKKKKATTKQTLNPNQIPVLVNVDEWLGDLVSWSFLKRLVSTQVKTWIHPMNSLNWVFMGVLEEPVVLDLTILFCTSSKKNWKKKIKREKKGGGGSKWACYITPT